MNVYIRKDTSYYFPIIYVLKVIEKNREIKFDFLDNPNNSKIIWDHENENSQVENPQVSNSSMFCQCVEGLGPVR